MSKVSAEAKSHYAEKLREYKARIESLREIEKGLQAGLAGSDTPVAPAKLSLVDASLNLVSFFNTMNSLSVALLGIRNEGYLNDARKLLYKGIILLEELVSNLVDAPFSDYEERLAELEELGDEKRLGLIRKLGFAIDTIEEAFGDNSKWRWSFVEIEGRFATVVKNLLNLKTLNQKLDPRHPSYRTVHEHLALAKRLLQQAADRYREKYELSTLRLDDIRQAIGFLAALRRLHIILAEADEADVVRKKIEVWKHKMEEDQRKSEAREAQKR